MPPARYLYLVDEELDELLGIWSCDDLVGELEIMTLEARLRAEHQVDDASSGLALRDSLTRPLDAGLLARAWRARSP